MTDQSPNTDHMLSAALAFKVASTVEQAVQKTDDKLFLSMTRQEQIFTILGGLSFAVVVRFFQALATVDPASRDSFRADFFKGFKHMLEGEEPEELLDLFDDAKKSL